MPRAARSLAVCLALLAGASAVARGQDRVAPGSPTMTWAGRADVLVASHFGSSPFAPPEHDDQTFVVDVGPGLDTGCTFRDGSPLVFTIRVDRVLGDRDALLAEGAIPDHLTLEMPAYDVDFDAVVPPYAPERDRVYFNGHPVDEVFLTGANNVWKLNSFRIPIEWVHFPPMPAPGSSSPPEPAENTIRIDIDTANSELVWCTAIDWASLRIDRVPRPVVMAHGILSSGATWAPPQGTWVPSLADLGLPGSNNLNMGNLDGIGSNAAKIAAEVSASKTRWGVDRVNIVAHSKGGLDSREYAESSNDVDQLLQIGTPNAGSPLADLAQRSLLELSIRFPLIAIPALIADLALPAGVQLTTPYMAGYNLFHGANPNVTYVSMAGDYDPDCLFCWETIANGIVGRPSDTIVPVWSVHALPYSDHRVIGTVGANVGARHIGETNSPEIFAALRDRTLAPGRPLPTVAQAASDPSAELATYAGAVASGEVQSFTVAVDENAVFDVTLFYTQGDLDLELVAPDGTVFNHANTVGSVQAGFDDAAVYNGRLETFSHRTPQRGTWTVRVRGTSVLSGTESFLCNGWLESPATTLHAAIEPAAVTAGGAFTITASLVNAGVPLAGGSAVAYAQGPLGPASTLTLLDDGVAPDAAAGDGVFSASAPTSTAGMYRFAVSATGPVGASGVAPTRQGFLLGSASTSASHVGSGFADHGVDLNANGLYDQLVVDVPLVVTAAANYRVVGVLQDASGHAMEAAREVALTPGAATVALSFDGRTLHDRGVNGPYLLTDVRLAEVDGLALMPLQVAQPSYSTAAYAYTQFEHGLIQLRGTGSDEGVDFDANGLFDQLRVRVGVIVDRAGFYQWSGRLTDPDGIELGFTAGAATFSAGDNELTFTYAGEPIGQHGVDGPYHVRSVLLYGAGASIVVPEAYTTSALLARQFEGYVQRDTTPPVLSVHISPTESWPPSHQLVPISTDIQVVDDYDANPVVTLESITSNEAADAQGDGSTSPDIVIDPVTGAIQLRSERSGTGEGRLYTLTWSARDAADNVSTAVATFSVGHDRGNAVAPSFLAVASVSRGSGAPHWNLRWDSSPTIAVDRVAFTLFAPGEDPKQLVDGSGARNFARVPIPLDYAGGGAIEVVAYSGNTVVASQTISLSGQPAVTGVGTGAPGALDLRFLSRTTTRWTVAYRLPSAGSVDLSLYDVRGRRVATLGRGWTSAGEHRESWAPGSSNSVPSGVYFLRLRHASGEKTLKVAVMR